MNNSGSNKFYETLFDLYPQGVMLLESETGKIIRCSRNVLTRLGLNNEETCGLGISEILFNKSGESFNAVTDLEISSGYSRFYIKTNENKFLPVGIKIEETEYNEQNCLLVFIDVPNTDTADNTFLYQLASIVESSDDAIISKDLKGTVISWNKAAEKVYGYSAGDMIGNSILKIYPENRKGELGEILGKIEKGQSIEHFETERVRKNGQHVFISVTMSPVKDIAGKIKGASSIERDITEKIAEEKERDIKKKQLEEAQQIAHLGYWEMNLKSGGVQWSDELYKIYGLDKNEFVPTEENFISKIHPDDRQNVKSIFEKALQDHRPFELNFRILPEGGTSKIIYCKGEVLLDNNFTPLILRGIDQDITQQKRSEKRLGVQIEVTRILAGANRLLDAAPKILQAVCEGMEWQIGELWLIDITSNLLELEGSWYDKSLDAAEFIEVSKKCKFGKGVSLQGRTWESRKPGWSSNIVEDQFFPRAGLATKLKLHSALAFPVFNKENVNGVLAFYKVDISEPDSELLKMLDALGRQIGDYLEKKKTEPALKESEGLYQTLVETSPDAITYTDLGGKIIFCNQQAAELFGYRFVDDIIGQNVYAFIAPEDQHHAVENEHSTIVNGSTKNIQYTLLKKDGTRFSAEINTSIVFDAERGPKAFIGVMRDISERKKAEIELKTRAKQHAIIAEIGQSALIGTDIQDLMDKLSELISKTLQVEFCCVWEYLDVRKQLFLRAGIGWKPGTVGNTFIKPGKETHAGFTLESDQPVIINNILQNEIIKKSKLLADHKVSSGVTVIIRGSDKPYGVLGVYSRKIRTFSENDANFLQAVSNIIGTAIERKHVESELAASLKGVKDAKEQLEFSKKRLEYLAEASRILNSSLDYKKTLQTVAELIIRELADWCVIDVLDEKNELKRMVIAHADPMKLELAGQFEKDYPPNPESEYGIYKVIKTGEPLLFRKIDENLINKISRDQRHRKILNEMGFKSALIVPLKSRDRLMGGLTLVSSNENRIYDENDLVFAQDLAFRASGAIDNSTLFQQSKTTNQRLERKVKERTSELEISNTELEVEIKMRQKIAEELKVRVLQQSAIAEMGQRALMDFSLPELVCSTADTVMKTLNIDFCGVFELSEEKNKIQMVAGKGWKNIKGNNNPKFEDAGPLIDHLLSSDEPVIIENFIKQNNFENPGFLKENNIRSGMCAVIKGKNKPFGILAVFSSKIREYTANDSFFLTALSNILTVFMDRKHTEELSQKMIEAIPDALIIIDGEGKIVLTNSRTELMFDYEKGEILNKDLEILVPARFRNQHIIDRKKYSEKPWHRPMHSDLELYGRKKDGTEFPIDISLSPYNSKLEKLTITSIRDISARKRSDEIARQKALVFDNISGAVISTDLNGVIRNWNKGAERLYGYNAEEATGKNISLLYGEDKQKFVNENIIKPLRKNGFLETEMDMKKKSGEEFFAGISLSLIKNKKGKMTEIVGYSSDISAIKKAKTKLDSFITVSPEAYLLADINGKILNLSKKAENYFGYSKEELIGRNLTAVLSTKIIEGISELMKGSIDVFDTFETGEDKNIYGINKDDEKFLIGIGINSLETENGKVIVCSIRKVDLKN